MLSETGFIDNAHDAAFMKQASWTQNVAVGHVSGLAKAFSLKPKAPASGTIKVIAGPFKLRENAEERVDFLRSEGFESFVATATINGASGTGSRQERSLLIQMPAHACRK